MMYAAARKLLEDATSIIVIKAENPDGDSLGSSLALEEPCGTGQTRLPLLPSRHS